MPGVYIIQNIVDHTIYVGKANNPPKRWKQHKDNYLKKRYNTSHLYNAFDKYGIDMFSFQVLETYDTSKEALDAEEWWINYLQTIGARLYNLTRGGEGGDGRPPGIPCTEETKLIIGQKNKESWKSERGFKRRESILKTTLDFDNDFSCFDEEEENEET